MTDPRGRHVTLKRPEPPSDPNSMHHGGSFSKYMQFKNQKLREQFIDDAAAALDESDEGSKKLFAGISIHVNGFTNPTHQELKQIMASYGGRFEVYYFKNRVTHIICSNLPTAKIKALEKERTSTPIVRPEWIVESLKAGKVLPHEDFLLWRLRDTPGQSTLSEFRPQPVQRSLALDNGDKTSPTTKILHQPAAILSKPLAALERPSSALQPSSSKKGQEHTEALCSRLEQSNADECSGAGHPDGGQAGKSRETDAQDSLDAPERQDCPAALPRDQEHASNALFDEEDVTQPQEEHPCNFQPPANSMKEAHVTSGDQQRAQQVAASCRAACDLLKGAPKSTRDDPQFMDNYYKSSRLHFIGTWKARIEALAAQASGSSPTPTSSAAVKRAIIHLDMDCFFASVAALSDPSLKGLPLAVCHSNSAQGTGEVSSANYEARAFGIGAMMCIGEAKRLCPSLVVMPYQYDKYQTISEQVYKILMETTAVVQPLSVDEAFLDVTGLGDAEELAASIRERIHTETGCTASAGIAHNMLLARIATKAGKPNGQFKLTPEKVDQHLLPLKVDILPGVGWSTRQRLQAMSIETVADLRQSSQSTLQRELGAKNGAMLWAAAQGEDERPVEPAKLRRSVGAEVNWGIRFTCEADADTFLDGLAGELHNRMVEAGVKGRSISLKMKRRKSNAPEPIKFLGHGPCDNISRSITLNRFTDSAADLTAEARSLLRALRVPAVQIRGIGISVSKLDNDPASSISSSGRGALPRAAPSIATVFRPFRRGDIGNSELTKEDLVAAGKSGDPYSGIVPERMAMLPKALQQLASPEKQHIAQESIVPDRSQTGLSPHSGGAARSPHKVSGLISYLRGKDVLAGSQAGDLLRNEAGYDMQSQHQAMPLTAESLLHSQTIADQGDTLGSQEATQSPGYSRAAAKAGNTEGILTEDGHSDGNSMSDVEDDEQDDSLLPNLILGDQETWSDGAEDTDMAIPSPDKQELASSATPIVALPPASQIDPSVLDALPLQLKREFELAYGINRIRSPPNDGKRKARGGRQPTLGRPAKKPSMDTQAVLKGTRQHSELTPSRVDLKVLKELPLELQQEVAADLARAQRSAAMRPLQPSSFVQFPAAEPLAGGNAVASAAEEDEAEQPAEIWPQFEVALGQIEAALAEEVSEQTEEVASSQRRSLTSQSLMGIGQLVLDFGRGLVADNLEGLQFILRQLQRMAQRCPNISASLLAWASNLEAAVSEHWAGGHLYTKNFL